MQKYKQYCPVARASEILADRWTPLIVRELILGSHRFNEIERGLPGISRSLLASRLRDLEDAGVIERLPGAQPGGDEPIPIRRHPLIAARAGQQQVHPERPVPQPAALADQLGECRRAQATAGQKPEPARAAARGDELWGRGTTRHRRDHDGDLEALQQGAHSHDSALEHPPRLRAGRVFTEHRPSRTPSGYRS